MLFGMRVVKVETPAPPWHEENQKAGPGPLYPASPSELVGGGARLAGLTACAWNMPPGAPLCPEAFADEFDEPPGPDARRG
jgi:hypothetical protein